MIISDLKCIYKSYMNYLDWMNLSIPEYMKKSDCELCDGELNDSRPCHINLERLLKLYRLMNEEIIDQLEGNLL